MSFLLLIGTECYATQKSISPSSISANLSPSSVPVQQQPPSCLQFSSCAIKPSSIPAYYPTPVSLLPYKPDWTQHHRQQLNYNRFSNVYEANKPAQLSNFLPPSPKEYLKSESYPQQTHDMNLSEWYVCQNAAPIINTENNDRQNPNLIAHQAGLTMGF